MNNPVAQSKRIYFRPLELEDIKNGWQKWINDSEANEFLDGIYPQTKDKITGQMRKISGFKTTYKRMDWNKPAPTITMFFFIYKVSSRILQKLYTSK